MNPFSAFIAVQHQIILADQGGGGGGGQVIRYEKGYKDVLFLVYWIVVFSFVRQVLTLGPIRALGQRFRLKGRKLERFQEQVSLQ